MKKVTIRTIDTRNDWEHSDPTFAAVAKDEPIIYTIAWRNPKDFNPDGTRKTNTTISK